MATTPAQFQAAADKIVQLAPLEDQFVHGNDSTDVPTANGPVPSMAKIAKLARDATDVAVKAIDMFPSTAAGVAGTSPGEYFDVLSADPDSFGDRYQNVGGAAVSTGKSYPSTSGVQALFKEFGIYFSRLVVVDTNTNVVKYPDGIVAREGAQLAFFGAGELPYIPAFAGGELYHFFDVALLGVASPYFAAGIGNMPARRPTLIPLGVTKAGRYTCFFDAEPAFTNRAANTSVAFMPRPAIIDRAGAISGEPAAYLPRRIYVVAPDVGYSADLTVVNPVATELAGDYAKIPLGNAVAALGAIYLDITSSEYKIANYPALPSGTDRPFVPLYQIWGVAIGSPVGLPFVDSAVGLDRSELDALDARNRAFSNAVRGRQFDYLQRPTAKYNIFCAYGQSLGWAMETWPAMSRANRFGNKSLGQNSNPASPDGSVYDAIGGVAFHDLQARSVEGGVILNDAQEAALPPGAGAAGEPISHAWVNGAKAGHNQRVLAENDASRVFVAINASVPGVTIEQLSKINTQDSVNRFNRVVDGLTKARTAAGADSTVMVALAWMHGQWNYENRGGSWDKASYKTLEAKLFDDVIETAKTVYGQAYQPMILVDQAGAFFTQDVDSFGTPGLHIGMAQLEVAQEKPGVFMVCPTYPYPDKGLHLDSNGTRWIGAQFAKVTNLIASGQGWEPLSPLWVKQEGLDVYVGFHVPCAPLVWRQPYVGNDPWDSPYKGFRVTDDSGSMLPIPEIVEGTIVRLRLPRPTVGPVHVWYASKTDFFGNGCLADSDPAVALDRYEYLPERGMYPTANRPELVGKPYPLHNWCVAFYLPVGYERP